MERHICGMRFNLADGCTPTCKRYIFNLMIHEYPELGTGEAISIETTDGPRSYLLGSHSKGCRPLPLLKRTPQKDNIVSDPHDIFCGLPSELLGGILHMNMRSDEIYMSVSPLEGIWLSDLLNFAIASPQTFANIRDQFQHVRCRINFPKSLADSITLKGEENPGEALLFAIGMRKRNLMKHLHRMVRIPLRQLDKVYYQLWMNDYQHDVFANIVAIFADLAALNQGEVILEKIDYNFGFESKLITINSLFFSMAAVKQLLKQPKFTRLVLSQIYVIEQNADDYHLDMTSTGADAAFEHGMMIPHNMDFINDIISAADMYFGKNNYDIGVELRTARVPMFCEIIDLAQQAYRLHRPVETDVFDDLEIYHISRDEMIGQFPFTPDPMPSQYVPSSQVGQIVVTITN